MKLIRIIGFDSDGDFVTDPPNPHTYQGVEVKLSCIDGGRPVYVEKPGGKKFTVKEVE